MENYLVLNGQKIEVAKEWLSYNGLAPKDVFF